MPSHGYFQEDNNLAEADDLKRLAEAASAAAKPAEAASAPKGLAISPPPPGLTSQGSDAVAAS